jgi:hypothetical protein
MTDLNAPGLAERLESVRSRVAAAATASGRAPADITTIVVTKFHPASLITALHSLGVHDVGENRHQEAQAKAAELSDLDLRWHFVGQVQGKKARQVRSYADVIHSVDRLSLVNSLASAESSVDCFIQVNLTDDPARGGVSSLAPHAGSLSMGMSHDFEDAIAEGATHLRIGTAITGNRPVHG